MNAGRTVYLDYAATTPVDPRVAAAMARCLTGDGAFANPNSAHAPGREAHALVERARAQVAGLIGAKPASIVWTASATEAINLAILGVARHLLRGQRAVRKTEAPGHIVTSRVEHKAVLAPCRQLEKEGWRVTYIKPDANGVVHSYEVAQALAPDTALVSIMHVNNETGAINDVAALSRLCRERGVLFHVDAAQSAGKLPIDVRATGIDLLSLGAHKLYGPKGVGALYVRSEPPIGLEPVLFGGGQEHGLRPGTLATHQIAGMGLACEIAASERAADTAKAQALRQRLWRGFEQLGDLHRNGTEQTTVPQILNVTFNGVHGESLQAGLDGLAVSNGSTCNSAQEASYVLRALGRSDAQAEASIRFSLGRFTTEADIDTAIGIVTRTVRRLRELSPANPPPAGNSQTAEAGSIDQGTWIRALARISGERIAEIRFQAYGCPHTLAACEWLEHHLPGRPLNSLLPGGAQALAASIAAPTEKLGRLLVLEDVLEKLRHP